MTDCFATRADTTKIIKKLETAYLSGQNVPDSRRRRALACLRLGSLAARESGVMTLPVDGCSNKKTAGKRSTSPRTLEIHRMKMMAKFVASLEF